MLILFPFILLLTALNIAGLIFWVMMIIECATREPSDEKDKVIWMIIVVFTSWIGALIYYFVRRPERIRLYGE